MILYAPRRVTLPPNQPQSIRMSARAPEGLPDGEYRVHMLFRAIPPPRPAVAPQKVEGVAFQLTPIYGVTIPVIVRLGNLEAKAGLANVRKVTEDGKPAIALDISRSGDRSTFGEVRVLKAGVADPIAHRQRRRGLHRTRPALGHHPDRSGPRRQGERPGDGPICRADRHRPGHHRRNHGGPALGPAGARGRPLDAAANPLDARRSCVAGARLRRAPLPHGRQARSARPGPPIPTTSSCSTSTSASSGSATACAPTRRPKAPASSSATS